MGGGRHRLPKDGEHSVGVQRQYCATLGKTANCQLGVSVNAVTEQASCPLDWRLFLPEAWQDDTRRRAACQVPEPVRHRPKWQLVLEMVDELAAWELRPPVLVADAGYGEVGEFRQGLDDRDIGYLVQVKAIEERFQTGKGLCGLDQHQVRRWTSWYRWATLSMLAHAFLVVAALTEHAQHPPPPGLIRLSCNELQHLFAALVIQPIADAAHRLRWSQRRRRHQARARTCYYRRQAAWQQ